jgi:hypothetical protein
MEAKLRQYNRHFTRLLLLELNPNPLADNFDDIPKLRSFPLNQSQQRIRWQSPILLAAGEINC